MLTYRSAQHDDFFTISQFPQTPSELYFCFPTANFPLTVSQLSATAATRRNLTVVEKAGEIAAFANFYQWQYQGCCKIGNVMVNPKYRKQGIASYLLSVMEKQAKDVFDATALHVACFNTNTIALLFYARIGFKLTSIEEKTDKNNQKIALIHMDKNL